MPGCRRALVWGGALAALVLSAPASADPAGRLDLRALSLSGPAAGVAGHATSVRLVFDAVGDLAPGPFHVAFFLTTNGTTSGAVPVATLGPYRLEAASSSTVTEALVLPQVVGRYRLAAVVDSGDEVAEYDELDNAAFDSKTISIRAEAPDLVVTSVRAREAELRAGETLHADVALANRGEVAATTVVGLYLSRGPTVSTADVLLGTTSVTLGPGETASLSMAELVPAGLDAGAWTIGAIADPTAAITEVSETNDTGTAVEPLTIFSDTVAIVTPTVTDGSLDVAYHVVLAASGGNGRYRWSVSDGALPPGLALDLVAGVVSGVPVASGRYRFGLGVTSHGATAERSYELQVWPTGVALHVVDTPLLEGPIGHAYEQRLVAFGGEPPYVWTLSDALPNLPLGLDLGPDGIIAGTPNTLGDFHFGVVVRDRTGATAEAELEIAVVPPVNVVILHRDAPTATVAAPFDFALSATGGVPPYTWHALSATPPGLMLTSSGHLEGTPTQVGRFDLLVRAKDSTRVGTSDTLLLSIDVVDDGALAITTTELPAAFLRVRYEVTLEATGGTPPLTWSLVPGSHLPQDFFLVQGDGTKLPADAAVIRGLTVHPTTQAFAVEVVDAYGRQHQRVLLLDIQQQSLKGPTATGCTCTSERSQSALGLVLALAAPLFVRRRARRDHRSR